METNNQQPPLGCKVIAVMIGLLSVCVFLLGIIKTFEILKFLWSYFGQNPIFQNL